MLQYDLTTLTKLYRNQTPQILTIEEPNLGEFEGAPELFWAAAERAFFNNHSTSELILSKLSEVTVRSYR